MHRRTNSYSYTVSSSSNHIPPPLAVAKRLSNSHHSEEFVRNTLDRRSYNKQNTSLSANKGYRTVTLSLAVPGTIRYSIEEMYRPRSPNKPLKSGVKCSDVAIPELDNALTDIREQLVSRKD